MPQTTPAPTPTAVTSAVPPQPRSRFRADIQALRAIAVGLVILNHLWPARLPGGYIGVDIFFVISGFLITTHLLAEESRTGRIRFARFYARRAQRLLPAALLVSLLSLIGAVVFLPVARWRAIAEETFAASAYWENWLLGLKSVDYSAQNDAATTAQHYWSLSVEEQFYVLWPLAMMALILAGRWMSRRRSGPGPLRASPASRRALVIGAAVIALASFAFAVWLTQENRSIAYFHTLTRVWEFMLGALIALWLLRAGPDARSAHGSFLNRLTPSARGAAQWAGLLMLGGAALTFSSETPFPGPWAIVPALGTALIILAGPSAPGWSPIAWLGIRPVQFAGDISYSLYLWHWPLIVLLPGVLGRDLRFRDRVLILALTLLLAWLTKRYVEDPGRTRLFRTARPRRVLLATLASVMSMALLCGAVMWSATRLEAQAREESEAFRSSDCAGAGSLAPGADCGDPYGPAQIVAQSESEVPWFTPADCAGAAPEEQILVGGSPVVMACDFPPVSDQEPLDVWVIGDSHGQHWSGAFLDIGRANGWQLRSVFAGGCPVIDLPRVAFKGAPEPNQEKANECLAWSAEVTQRLRDDAPDLILVSTFGAGETVSDGTDRSQTEQYRDPADRRFSEWTATGATVVVIRDVPLADQTLGPDCALQNRATPENCAAPREEALPADPLAEAAANTEVPNVWLADLSEFFCDDQVCHPVIGGIPVFYDSDHIGQSFARSLAPALTDRLSDIMGGMLAAPRREAPATD